MDWKEFLPFLAVLAFSIVGSIAKGKKRKGEKPASKNVFETFFEELKEDQNNDSRRFDEPPPAYQQDFQEMKEPYFQEEPAKEIITNSVEEKPAHIGLLEEYKARNKRENPNRSYAPMEVIQLGGEVFESSDFQIINPEEARRAIIYSEIIKPKHF